MCSAPKYKAPPPAPPMPSLVDRQIRDAGAAATTAALSGTGRAASFLTAGVGGAAAPVPSRVVRSPASGLPWDFTAPVVSGGGSHAAGSASGNGLSGHR